MVNLFKKIKATGEAAYSGAHHANEGLKGWKKRNAHTIKELQRISGNFEHSQGMSSRAAAHHAHHRQSIRPAGRIPAATQRGSRGIVYVPSGTMVIPTGGVHASPRKKKRTQASSNWMDDLI